MTDRAPRPNETLEWLDDPARALIRLAWPIVVSLVSYSVMTLVDTLFISRLGAPALAGVGFGGVCAFISLCFGFGLLRGVQTLVAQAVGAGHRDAAAAYLGAGLVSALGLGIAITTVGRLLAPSLAAISASPEAAEHMRVYLGIRLLGAVPTLLYVALREARYGIGDSRTPMRAVVVANVLHVELDYFLIFTLGFGTAGAAWATVASETFQAIWLVLASWGTLHHIRSARADHVRALWSIGWPLGLQFLLEVGAFALLTAMIASWSETEMAAHQIALQVLHLSFLPAMAVSEAAAVLSGQAVGAGRADLVRRVGRAGLAVAGLYAGACTIVLAAGAHLVVDAFTRDPALAHTARMLLYVACVFQIADAANVVARGTLRGTGDVRFPAWAGIATAWVVTPPLAWLLGRELGLGALGGWCGLCLEIFACALLMWWRLEREAWRGVALRYEARAHALAT